MLGTGGETNFDASQLLQDKLVDYGQERLGDVTTRCPGLGPPPFSLVMGNFYLMLGRGWENRDIWCN